MAAIGSAATSAIGPWQKKGGWLGGQNRQLVRGEQRYQGDTITEEGLR